MKKMKYLLSLVAVFLLATTFVSCDNDDDNWRMRYANALVTVKTDGNVCYFQLDDNTTLLPANITQPLYNGKEVRALVNYDELPDMDERYGKKVHVNWVDSILTKKPVTTEGSDVADADKYGDDVVDVVNDWVTIAEDGYLTLRFRALWGGQKAHRINLVTGVNPKDPYEVELRHDSNGDAKNYVGDALVAFRLKDVMPDTGGKTVKLTLKCKTAAGYKTYTFDYATGKTTTSANLLHGGIEALQSVQ